MSFTDKSALSFSGYNNLFEQSKKPSTASDQVLRQIRPTKSANDLSNLNNLPQHLRHSAVEVSRDPRGAQQDDPRNGVQNIKLTKNQEKEQKRLEKQRLAEHKAREKQAREEQAKQERLKREREKKNAQQIKEQRERRPEKKKKSAPQPQVVTPVTAETSQQYSTNTVESSISRSSGPPPYSDVPTMVPEPSTITQNQNKTNKTDNIIFKKPEDTGSWDMISQHRQQTIRPTSVIGSGGSKNKPKVMDLNYNVGASSKAQDNSEA